jgi:hypothetical protein
LGTTAPAPEASPLPSETSINAAPEGSARDIGLEPVHAATTKTTSQTATDGTVEGHGESGRLARLELVFMHTSRAGAGPLRRLLENCYGGALRTEYNSQPPQHRFDPGEIKYWVDWPSRLIPQSGRAFAVNFLMQPHDVMYTLRPLRFVTLVREPIARVAGEFLAFRRDIEARGGADEQTREIASDIVCFADLMMRNDYLVRFFSGTDVCDPIEDKHAGNARAALARLDVVGRHEDPRTFVRKVLELDVFTRDEYAEARAAFAADMSAVFSAPGDQLAAQLDSRSRKKLEQRNLRDLQLYRWIATELTHD